MIWVALALVAVGVLLMFGSWTIDSPVLIALGAALVLAGMLIGFSVVDTKREDKCRAAHGVVIDGKCVTGIKEVPIP